MNEANRSFFIIMHKISKAFFVISLKKKKRIEVSFKRGLQKLASASIGHAMLMRTNNAETAVHDCLIPSRVMWLCLCVR